MHQSFEVTYPCPSEECPMCTGETCSRCGAGYLPSPHCEHDVIDRHRGDEE